MKRILITGGVGFIGSHTSILLLQKGFDLIVVDSFLNSSKDYIDKINFLIKNLDSNLLKKIKYFDCDIRNYEKLSNIFFNSIKEGNPIDAVIHFAGLKAVGESVKNPLMYWEINVAGSINLF